MEIDWRRILPQELQEGIQLASRSMRCPAGTGKIALVVHSYSCDSQRRTRQRYPPPSVIKPKAQKRYRAVSLVLAGQARFGGQELAPGDIFLVRGPENRHGIQAGKGYVDSSLLFMDAFADVIDSYGLWPTAEHHWRQPPSAALIHAIGVFHQKICNHALSDDNVLRAGLGLLERWLAGTSLPTEEDSFSSRACRILHDHPEPTFTMGDAARAMGMSERSFREHFRHQLGMPPSVYQLRERINIACELLPQMDVQRCAQQLGYKDPAFFSRQFKNILGLPPSAFTASMKPDRHSG